MRVISYLIFIFFTPALILLNFNFLVFNSAYYKSQFTKLNVYETFESKEIVDNQSQRLIGYLCCGKELDRDFFAEREILHLSDVKKIITLNQAASVLFVSLVLAGFIILILKTNEKEFVKTILVSSTITILSIVFLRFSTFINFVNVDQAFLQFHYLAFDNDLWQLPESANLIKLFPQQFFVNFANRIAIHTLIISAGLFLASAYFLKRHDSKKH